MTAIAGTNLAALIVPFDTADTFPTHDAQYGKGGYRAVASLADRDAISEDRLSEGMIVYVLEDATEYRLAGAAWVESRSRFINVTPDSHPLTPKAADDEFEYGTSIDTTGARRSGATPWSFVNLGGSSADVVDGAVLLQSLGSGSDNLHAVGQVVSGDAWKYRAKLSGILTRSSLGVVQFGMGCRASSNGRYLTFLIRWDGTNWLMCYSKWLSSTSMYEDTSTSPVFATAAFSRSPRAPIYLELELLAGALYARYSDTGHEGTFRDFYAANINTWLSEGITDVDLLVSSANSAETIAVFDWFRDAS